MKKVNRMLNGSHHPTQLLVRFKTKTPPNARGVAHANASAIKLNSYRFVDGLTLVNIPGGNLKTALVKYFDNPNVAYAEPDYVIESTASPNDPSFVNHTLWGLHNTTAFTCPGNAPYNGTFDADIDAPEAWDIWTGDPDFRIAVLDTGVNYNHEDLTDNIWVNTTELNGITFVDDDGNGWVDDIHGYDFFNSDGNPLDDNGHGTHVAGIIGAVGNNGIGVVGVNWQCKIVALKTFDNQGNGFVSATIKALEYVIDENIKVSNHSYRFLEFSQAHKDMIAATQAIGHIIVGVAIICGIRLQSGSTMCPTGRILVGPRGS